MKIQIEINDFKIRPKERPRTRVINQAGKKPFAVIYNSKNQKENEAEFKKLVQIELSKINFPSGKMFPGEVCLRLDYETKRKQGKRQGDIDNYLKTVMDALNGFLYEDDSQVLQALISLEFGAEAEKIKLIIND